MLARYFVFRLVILLAMSLSSSVSIAVEPNEVLQDVALEQRARALSAGIRCMVCQNQSIDDSDADLARDLRVLVRERLVSGDTDEQVLDYLVGRYGEFVLLKPKFGTHTLLLWGAPLIVIILSFGLFGVWIKSGRTTSIASLSDEENVRLNKLLDTSDD